MKKTLKVLLVLCAISVFLLSCNVKPALAQDNSELIAKLQQEIQILTEKIIALIQESTATLTVNAYGGIAYISINGGEPFSYISPLMLHNGDKYSVTASKIGSMSKCSGTASSGGKYSCNITISQY